MSNLNRVGSDTPLAFDDYRIGFKVQVPLGVSGNASAMIPIMSGGLTANTGGVILRRITLKNPSGSVAAANVSISSGSIGVLAGPQILTTLTGTGLFQDLTLISPATTTAVTDSFLNVNIVTGSVANNTVDIAIYGQTVQG